MRARQQKIEQLALTFDDVQILDGYSKLESRSNVDLEVDGLGMPVFNAQMDTVISVEMANHLMSHGAGVIHHRADSVETRIEKIEASYEFQQDSPLTDDSLLGVAVGLEENLYAIQRFIEAGAELIAVKVAAAFNIHVKRRVAKIKKNIDRNYPGVDLMVGNVSDVNAMYVFKDYADWICVSQGGGSVCSTRKKTGVGKPTFQATMDMHNARTENWTNGIEDMHDVKIVADGGLRKNGDIVKALGAGAHAVMLGEMLAGHEQCPDQYSYRGMASEGAKEDRQEEVKHIEGVEKQVCPKGNVHLTLDRMNQDIRSGIGTAGCDNLEDFIGNARFVRVTQNGVREADEHFDG